jgi:hypothetical protein
MPDGQVLELKVGCDLHQLGPVRAGLVAHSSPVSRSDQLPARRTGPRTGSPG